jgi:23S rRNA maturation mini-RNase III
MSEREFLESISGQDEEKMLMYSPSQLAYIGDSIYEILVRSYIIKNSDVSVNQMHRHTIKFVKAKSQAELVKNLDPIYRGRKKDYQEGQKCQGNIIAEERGTYGLQICDRI